jgi:alpha-tubulin suppressor-like RCC1 family protein
MGKSDGRVRAAELYREYGPAVYRRCVRLLRDREAARDATQEIFMKLLRDVSKLEDHASALPWVYRVAMNVMSSFTAGDAFTCATGPPSGAVKCWGSNTSGQIGIGTAGGAVTSPTDTELASGAQAVAAGGAHACALVQDSAPPGDVTVRCWGANDRGQVGDGTSSQRPTPTPISG